MSTAVPSGNGPIVMDRSCDCLLAGAETFRAGKPFVISFETPRSTGPGGAA
jgi:hypothetical protein